MPSLGSQFRKLVRNEISDIYNSDIIVGLLGDENGTIYDSNDRRFVYVTVLNGQVIRAYNDRIYANRRLPVRVKKIEGVYQILGYWQVYADNIESGTPAHADQHQYPNADTLFVKIDQFLQFLVLPTSGFNLQLYGGATFFKNTLIVLDNQTIDLSAYAISGTGAKYILIQCDLTGTISIVDGTTAASIDVLALSDAPLPDTDNFPIAYIRLYEGQTYIRRDNDRNDIIDVRINWHSESSSGGGGSGGAFQRILSANLTLANGESLVLSGYINIGSYILTLNGDSRLEIL